MGRHANVRGPWAEAGTSRSVLPAPSLERRRTRGGRTRSGPGRRGSAAPGFVLVCGRGRGARGPGASSAGDRPGQRGQRQERSRAASARPGETAQLPARTPQLNKVLKNQPWEVLVRVPPTGRRAARAPPSGVCEETRERRPGRPGRAPRLGAYCWCNGTRGPARPRQRGVGHLQAQERGRRALPGAWARAPGGPPGSSVRPCRGARGQQEAEVGTRPQLEARTRAALPDCQATSKEEAPGTAVLRSLTLFLLLPQCHTPKSDLQVGFLWKGVTNLGSNSGTRHEKQQPGD